MSPGSRRGSWTTRLPLGERLGGTCDSALLAIVRCLNLHASLRLLLNALFAIYIAHDTSRLRSSAMTCRGQVIVRACVRACVRSRAHARVCTHTSTYIYIEHVTWHQYVEERERAG